MRNKGSQVWITTGKVSPLIPFGKYAEIPRNDRSVTKYGEGETPVVRKFGEYGSDREIS